MYDYKLYTIQQHIENINNEQDRKTFEISYFEDCLCEICHSRCLPSAVAKGENLGTEYYCKECVDKFKKFGT